jgi:hypothetical protein
MLLAACAPPIWRGYSYDPVRADAARDAKPMFVYLRSWASVESTRFEESVLNLPEVRTALAPFYSVVLEYSADRERAEKWGVQKPPAAVFLGASGEVTRALGADLSKATLLDAIRELAPPAPAASP